MVYGSRMIVVGRLGGLLFESQVDSSYSRQNVVEKKGGRHPRSKQIWKSTGWRLYLYVENRSDIQIMLYTRLYKIELNNVELSTQYGMENGEICYTTTI